MKTPQSIFADTLNDLCILAIEALDNLVTHLVKASHPKPLPGFLDWIADVMTPFVEAMVASTFCESRFKNSLEIGHPEVAMSLWVRYWVKSSIVSKYPTLALHIAELPLPIVQNFHYHQVRSEISTSFPKERFNTLRFAKLSTNSSVYFTVPVA